MASLSFRDGLETKIKTLKVTKKEPMLSVGRSADNTSCNDHSKNKNILLAGTGTALTPSSMSSPPTTYYASPAHRPPPPLQPSESRSAPSFSGSFRVRWDSEPPDCSECRICFNPPHCEEYCPLMGDRLKRRELLAVREASSQKS